MRVRYVKTRAGEDGVITAGEVKNLRPEDARAEVKAGNVILLDEDSVEAATAEERETGMLPGAEESARPRRAR